MSVGSTGIRFDGLATGLDTSAIIEAILGVERQPLLGIERRQSELEAEQGLFRDLNTRLLALEEAAHAIDNQNEFLTGSTLDEEFLDYQASSSDESILTAEATGTASPGSVDVTVLELAQVGRQFSEGFADATAVIATSGQTFSIDYGGAANIDITVDADGASLEELRDLINADPNNVSGVRAEVLFDGTSSRLIVSGLATGAANDISITTDIDGPGGAGTPFIDPVASGAQQASDARINVFGIDVTRPDNTITDVIPGVTLRLRAADPVPITVGIEIDQESIEADLQALVDAYNAIREFSTTQSTYDEDTETAGPLSGDLTLRGVERDLQSAMTASFSFAGNPFTSFSDIGIGFDSDGTTSEGRLTLDAEKLAAALDQDAGAVRQLLSGDGVEDGAATALGRVIEPIIRTGDGTLAIRDDGFEQQIRSYDGTIERMELRLEARELQLVQEYAVLETLISSLQSDADFLTALLTVDTGN